MNCDRNQRETSYLTTTKNGGTIPTMDKKRTTIKIWTDTRKLLRLIAASTGETILAAAQRLASAEWEKLRGTTPGVQNEIGNE